MTLLLILYDIIFVLRGSKEEHLKLAYQCFKNLDGNNLQKCNFAETESEWLCYKFFKSVIFPPERKKICNYCPLSLR